MCPFLCCAGSLSGPLLSSDRGERAGEGETGKRNGEMGRRERKKKEKKGWDKGCRV